MEDGEEIVKNAIAHQVDGEHLFLDFIDAHEYDEFIIFSYFLIIPGSRGHCMRIARVTWVFCLRLSGPRSI